MSIKPRFVSPFTIISSSVEGGYLAEVHQDYRSGIEVINYHENNVGHKDSVMQSPFTQKWVGGLSHRNVDPNDGNDTAENRQEAWHVVPNQASLRIYSHKFYNSPPAYWTKEEAARRSINVKNILTTTASISYGNFRLNYEVVHSFGRDHNSLLKNLVSGTEDVGVIRSRFVSASMQELHNTRKYLDEIQQQKNKTIIVNLFNAPGGINESSRASLDVAAEEMSPNISLNFRNISQRTALTTRHSSSAQQFNANNTFHGVNRNTLRRESGIVQQDNFFVQHQIPRTDIQYAWITSSATTTAIELGGYQSYDGQYNRGASFDDISYGGESDDRVFKLKKRFYNIDLKNNTLGPKPLLESDSIISDIGSQISGSAKGIFNLNGRVVIKTASDRRDWIILFGDTSGDSSDGSITFEQRFTTPIKLMVDTMTGNSSVTYNSDLGMLISPGVGIDPLIVETSTNLSTWTEYAELRRGTQTNYSNREESVHSVDIDISTGFYVRIRNKATTDNCSYAIRNIRVLPLFKEVDNSDYSFSTWKQIRTGEHEVARALRNSNIYSIENVPETNTTVLGGRRTVGKAKRSGVSNFTEPPVTFKYKPLRHTFIFKGNSQPFIAHDVVHTYNNILSMFANKELNNRVGAEEIRTQAYDIIKDFYLNSKLPQSKNPVSKFLGFKIEETVFPKEEHTGLAKTRYRQNFSKYEHGFGDYGYDKQLGTHNVFWRDDIRNRILRGLVSGSLNFGDIKIGGNKFLQKIDSLESCYSPLFSTTELYPTFIPKHLYKNSLVFFTDFNNAQSISPIERLAYIRQNRASNAGPLAFLSTGIAGNPTVTEYLNSLNPQYGKIEEPLIVLSQSLRWISGLSQAGHNVPGYYDGSSPLTDPSTRCHLGCSRK